ncbi:MAG: dephospho-CoA kinase [Proteobacteria bacterium]|nr:dephospho-CoA kinase [Pseudomonadota bacterium]
MSSNEKARAQLKRYGIGLTGGIATGKSTVARLLEARGYSVIDADQLARAVTAPGSPGLAQIVAQFGAEVLSPSGDLNRTRLGQIVFAKSELRQQLEQITHPLIRAALLARVEALDLDHQPKYFFYEAALIFEIGSAADYAQIWATVCAPDLQLERLKQRSGIDDERAKAIIANQMAASEKARRADQVIHTDGSLDSVAVQVDDGVSHLR